MIPSKNRKNLTVANIFADMLTDVEPLLLSVPQEAQGNLVHYIELTKHLREEMKPDNFSLPILAQVLGELNDTEQPENRRFYDVPLPTIHCQGEYEYGIILKKHLQNTVDNRKHLNLNDYSWPTRTLLQLGINKFLQSQIDRLSERLDVYLSEQKENKSPSKSIFNLYQTSHTQRPSLENPSALKDQDIAYQKATIKPSLF